MTASASHVQLDAVPMQPSQGEEGASGPALSASSTLPSRRQPLRPEGDVHEAAAGDGGNSSGAEVAEAAAVAASSSQSALSDRDRVAVLRRTPLFAQLTEEQIEALARRATARRGAHELSPRVILARIARTPNS